MKVDSVFIGSSPLMLMCHKKLNSSEDSLLVESSDRIGGAWYTESIWGIDNLELGCHILKNIDEGIAIMNNHGSNLKVMNPQPSVLIAKSTGESFLNKLKNDTLRFFKTFSGNKLYSKVFVNRLSGKNSQKYHYLNGGCFDLINNIKADNNIILNAKIISLVVQEAGVVIELENKEIIEAKNVYLPRNFKIDSILLFNKKIKFEYSKYVSEHYILKLSGKTDLFSFVDVVGDELLNLISNVGIYTKLDNETILAIAVKKNLSKSENNLQVSTFDTLPTRDEQKSIVNQIEIKLRAHNLINSNQHILDYHYEPYILDVRSNQSEFDLNILSKGSIQVFDTTDLIESVIKNTILNVH